MAIIFIPAGSVSSHTNYSAAFIPIPLLIPVVVPGKVFYRLVMTDQYGVKKYSRTIQLSRQGSDSFALVTVINPFNYSIEFNVSSLREEKIEAELIDLTGKVVQKNSFQVHAGINALSLSNTANLPRGTYIFRLKNNEMHINRKVIKRDVLITKKSIPLHLFNNPCCFTKMIILAGYILRQGFNTIIV